MERLTKRIDGSVVFPSELVGVTLTPDNEIMYDLLTRLADYEDVGLAPLDVAALALGRKIFEDIEINHLNEELGKAIEDLHFVMSGGNPCEICARKCEDGDGTCKPVWRGERNEETT